VADLVAKVEGNPRLFCPSCTRDAGLHRYVGPRIVLPLTELYWEFIVVATSQTTIASHFNHLDLQSYIGTAYVLGSTIFLPIFASLADIFGRYWTMQISIVIFLVGSALSTGATSMAMVLLGRGISGVGAAGLLAVSEALEISSRLS
jgi:MFS family permease